MPKESKVLNNYQDLIDQLLENTVEVTNGTLAVDKANSAVKNANAVVNILRAKIAANKTINQTLPFFEENGGF